MQWHYVITTITGRNSAQYSVSLADKYMSCYGLASHEEKRVFSQLLAPYIAELQNVIHPDRHVRKA